ncbi:MAG: Stp1/IreP family PP2C-type Ser/Thr phosphatase [Gemmatimonadota bacterium]|nr:Stp1/IreP family PP2C-type Ser/Thr phosphatase [Gemmatimonadota bacterium]
MQLVVAARTDVGMIRSGNEDSFFADPTQHKSLFVVADGMGGHAAGEVASEMAVQIISREMTDVVEISERASERMTKALRAANLRIYERTISEADKQGMGTTASVLLLANDRYLIGHIGDSRIYLLRDGALRQVTKDHSYVQEQVDAGYLMPEQARYHPYSNVITRCVGASDEVDVDIYEGEVKRSDIFLIASDGLTGMVDDKRLQAILTTRTSVGRMVDAMINEANGRGGLDNITAIIAMVLGLDGDPVAELPRTGEATAAQRTPMPSRTPTPTPSSVPRIPEA